MRCPVRHLLAARSLRRISFRRRRRSTLRSFFFSARSKASRSRSTRTVWRANAAAALRSSASSRTRSRALALVAPARVVSRYMPLRAMLAEKAPDLACRAPRCWECIVAACVRWRDATVCRRRQRRGGASGTKPRALTVVPRKNMEFNCLEGATICQAGEGRDCRGQGGAGRSPKALLLCDATPGEWSACLCLHTPLRQCSRHCYATCR